MELTSDQKEPETAEQPYLKWMLHVDGSSNANNGGADILTQGPKGVEIEVAARLSFPVTNNEAEYEALILGLELAHEVGARDLEVFTDSQLIALQIEGTYETRERTMTSYKEIVQRLMGKFEKCSVLQVPRAKNDKADALSKFRAAMDGIRDRKITALIRERSALSNRAEVQVVSETGSWKDEIVKYLDDGILPDDPIVAKRVKFRATRRGKSPLRDAKNPQRELRKPLRREITGPKNHATRILLAHLDQKFQGPSEEMRKLQKYASLIHQHATPMEPIRIACPFDQWGIDIVGPFPPAQAQKKFIIVAVEYFSKFRILRILISDSDTQFQGRRITEWCKELKIAQHFTAVANPQANGQTEVTNKTILQHLKMRLENKGSWVDELPGVFWCL
ncbi:UNVERIFIED_CONTAM: Ribonuclease HI [Sesamum indicum]